MCEVYIRVLNVERKYVIIYLFDLLHLNVYSPEKLRGAFFCNAALLKAIVLYVTGIHAECGDTRKTDRVSRLYTYNQSSTYIRQKGIPRRQWNCQGVFYVMWTTELTSRTQEARNIRGSVWGIRPTKDVSGILMPQRNRGRKKWERRGKWVEPIATTTYDISTALLFYTLKSGCNPSFYVILFPFTTSAVEIYHEQIPKHVSNWNIDLFFCFRAIASIRFNILGVLSSNLLNYFIVVIIYLDK